MPLWWYAPRVILFTRPQRIALHYPTCPIMLSILRQLPTYIVFLALCLYAPPQTTAATYNNNSNSIATMFSYPPDSTAVVVGRRGHQRDQKRKKCIKFIPQGGGLIKKMTCFNTTTTLTFNAMYIQNNNCASILFIKQVCLLLSKSEEYTRTVCCRPKCTSRSPHTQLPLLRSRWYSSTSATLHPILQRSS